MLTARLPIVVGALLAMAGCGGGSSAVHTLPSAAAGHAASAAAALPPLAQATAGRSSLSPSSRSGDLRRLSVVVCPTTFGWSPPPAPRRVHGTTAVSLPAGVKDAVVYTDSLGKLRLVGPRGWQCRAEYFGDQSAALIVYPAGERIPVKTWTAGWHLPQASKTEAISVVDTGPSEVQGAGAACPYFPKARTATMRNLGHGCARPPSSERLRRVDAMRVEFEDPARAPGAGIPSGGRNPVFGAVTYDPSATPETYLISCTVARRISKMCAADLDPSFEGSP
jgi:hypothetical protein